MVSGVEATVMQSSSIERLPSRIHDDAGLLADYARSGSPEVLARVVEQHSRMVYATCLRILGERSAAEDAAQATFLALVRKARTLPPRTLLGPWLHFAARNAALEIRRAEARRVRREKEAAEMANSPARNSVNHELVRELDEALGTLPAVQRDAVVLRYLYGFSAFEAARQLRCPEETLHTRLTRAMQRLRERFGQRGTVTSAVALAALLAQQGNPAAPVGLAGSITEVCTGKAAASVKVLATTDALVKAMALAHLKVLALSLTLALALAVGTPTVYFGIRAMRAPVAAASQPSAPVSLPVPTPPAVVASAVAPVIEHKAEVDAPSPLANFDFEDGRTRSEWIGKIEPGPPRPGNTSCIAGADVPESHLTRVRVGNNDKGLFAYRDGSVMDFDYWVDEKVFAVTVYVWDRTQAASIGKHVIWSPLKKHWNHETVDLATLQNDDGKKLHDGNLVVDVTFQTGEGGGALFVDNVKVAVPHTKH